jgi:hypothetical protein
VSPRGQCQDADEIAARASGKSIYLANAGPWTSAMELTGAHQALIEELLPEACGWIVRDLCSNARLSAEATGRRVTQIPVDASRRGLTAEIVSLSPVPPTDCGAHRGSQVVT